MPLNQNNFFSYNSSYEEFGLKLNMVLLRCVCKWSWGFISESHNCESWVKSILEYSYLYTSLLNYEEAYSRFSFQDNEHYFAKSCSRSLCISKILGVCNIFTMTEFTIYTNDMDCVAFMDSRQLLKILKSCNFLTKE